MKWTYILIILVIAAFSLGCVDENQTEIPSEMPLTPEPGEDLGTYSDLAELDNISSDQDMQIALSNEI